MPLFALHSGCFSEPLASFVSAKLQKGNSNVSYNNTFAVVRIPVKFHKALKKTRYQKQNKKQTGQNVLHVVLLLQNFNIGLLASYLNLSR